METSDIKFSAWYSVKAINDIPHGERTGVYIIACFSDVPQGAAQPDAKEVIYIGETHGKKQSIHKRLQSFCKAAKAGNNTVKHSGGNRFHEQFDGGLVNIYMAGFAPTLESEALLNSFIFYAERKLIWQYVKKWGVLPKCNGY